MHIERNIAAAVFSQRADENLIDYPPIVHRMIIIIVVARVNSSDETNRTHQNDILAAFSLV